MRTADRKPANLRTFVPALLIASTFIWLCMFLGLAASAQTMTGPGPDPACGGTELKVVRKGGRIPLLQQTFFASNRTIIERYEPLPRAGWKVTLLLYSSRWQKNEPLSEDRLVRSMTFTTSDKPNAALLRKNFGIGKTDWAAEPKRLLDYFRAHPSEFSK